MVNEVSKSGVDYQTTVDNTVTIRDRDTMEQHRVAIADLPSISESKFRPRS